MVLPDVSSNREGLFVIGEANFNFLIVILGDSSIHDSNPLAELFDRDNTFCILIDGLMLIGCKTGDCNCDCD